MLDEVEVITIGLYVYCYKLVCIIDLVLSYKLYCVCYMGILVTC